MCFILYCVICILYLAFTENFLNLKSSCSYKLLVYIFMFSCLSWHLVSTLYKLATLFLDELYATNIPEIPHQNPLLTPSFHFVPHTCATLPPLCSWKDIYVRAHHLNTNWKTGK